MKKNLLWTTRGDDLEKDYESDPSVGGFDLGKQIVDAYIAKYDAGSDEEASLSTLSVINAENFKTRLLPLLNALSEKLLSEAKNKGDINGLYNFYDELYSEYAAYENGVSEDNYDLFDLGNLLSALGCWQTEADNLSTDAIKNYQNPYTEIAAAIMTILDATSIQRWLVSLPSNDHIGKPIV